MSTADSGPASQNLIRLECFTPETLYGLPAAKNPENSGEIKVSSISGDNIEYRYNKENHNWKVTNDGKDFILSIGDNLCFHREGNLVNIYISKLLINPNDPTECVFCKLGNFRDANTQPSDETEQEQYDRAKMYLLSKAKFMPTKNDYDALYQEFIEYPDGDMRRYFGAFCLESNSRLKDYIRNRPDIALPLIENYINEIEILLEYTSKGLAIIILENAPDLLDPNPNPKNPNNQSNLDKFFHRSYKNSDVYVILSNLETTPEDKINQLIAL